MSYWTEVRSLADELGSDGCSCVPDWYLDCCLEHDIHYRTGKTLRGKPISRVIADARLRKCIQRHSPLGRLSPMSWWRWAGVRMFGRNSYKGRT